jgi:hypothetical protein
MEGSDFNPTDGFVSQPEAPAVEPTPTPAPELPPAVQKFQSCRWRQVAEDGVPEHCTHRDVQPMTGTTGFDSAAWCLDCQLYKIRRTPKKRPFPPPQDPYYY